jgi:hypothetical protein
MTKAASNVAFIRRQAAVSSIINAAISLGLFILVFRLNRLVPVWGAGNYAFDFLPQSFAVTFFSSFFPMLLTSKAMLAGDVAASKAPPTLLANLTGSILKGVAAAILLGGAFALVLRFAGVELLGTYPALAVKVAYGAVLGAIVTRVSIKGLLD